MPDLYWLDQYWVGTLPAASPVSISALGRGISDVAICSNALMRIGSEAIQSLTSLDSDRARVAARFYPETRDEMLRAHNWNFATIQQRLARIDAPLFGYAYAYQLPTDPYYLMLIDTSLDAHEKWEIQGRALLTDAPDVSITYVGRVVESLFDVLFTEALTDKLAFLFCFPLRRDAALADVLLRKAEDSFRRAKSRDGQESRPLRTFTSDTLTRVR